jgi:hypothetical protein
MSVWANFTADEKSFLSASAAHDADHIIEWAYSRLINPFFWTVTRVEKQ